MQSFSSRYPAGLSGFLDGGPDLLGVGPRRTATRWQETSFIPTIARHISVLDLIKGQSQVLDEVINVFEAYR